MRILIFGHTAFYNKKEVSVENMKQGGGWMESLVKELYYTPDLEIGLCDGSDAINYGGKSWIKEIQHNMAYYHWPYYKKTIRQKIGNLIHYNNAKYDENIWPYYMNIYKEIIDDYKPDVIHVFGSEVYLQLSAITGKDYPLVLHVQGIISLCVHILLPPGVSRWNYMMKDGIKKCYENFQELASWNKACHREKAILSTVSHVLGRTDWDRRAMEMLAPQAEYHYCGEMLRPIFYEEKERIIPPRPVIMTTLSSPLYKGYDLILKIADILKNQLHLDFDWNVYGGPNSSFINKHVGIYNEDVNVHLCGRVSAEHLREHLLNTTVYVQPSYVENSPNSLAEAEICGVPVVASNIGGTPSMVEDGVSGYLFPVTDPYMGAYFIKRLISDDKLNKDMGDKAKAVALERHDRKRILDNLLNIYKTVIEDEKNN